jgi:hypothetical protein
MALGSHEKKQPPETQRARLGWVPWFPAERADILACGIVAVVAAPNRQPSPDKTAPARMTRPAGSVGAAAGVCWAVVATVGF